MVHRLPGVTWVAVFDGLGHGPKAAEATALALDEIARFDESVSVDRALSRTHARLRQSRGAAATLARFDSTGLEIGGVGNVLARGLGSFKLPYVPTGGVIGGRMRRPRSVRVELPARTRLLIYTDGISRRAPIDALANLEPEALCAALMAEHSHLHDDATVVHLLFNG